MRQCRNLTLEQLMLSVHAIDGFPESNKADVKLGGSITSMGDCGKGARLSSIQ